MGEAEKPKAPEGGAAVLAAAVVGGAVGGGVVVGAAVGGTGVEELPDVAPTPGSGAGVARPAGSAGRSPRG